MNERSFLRPAVPLLIAFGVGILMGERLPGGGAYVWIAAGICLLWLTWDVAVRVSALFSPIVLFLMLGYISIQPWVSPQFPASHIVHHAGLTHECIRARLLTWPETHGSRISFIAAVESLGEEGKAATGRIRVSAGKDDASLLRRGDAVRFSGRIRMIRSFRNPGGFDYERFMAFQEIHCATYVRKGSLAVLTPAGWERPRMLPKESLPAAISSPADSALRPRIHARINEACPGDSGAILSALLVGDTSRIQPQLREQFNRAGISHLLAISGLHIGMILALSYGAFMRLFAFVPPLLWHGRLRKSAAMASLIPVLIYATLAQWSPSTQRAVCMAAAVCLALWFERPSDGGNNIVLAALAILVVFPPALFSISFQLSFAAVIAIVAGMPAVLQNRSPDERRISLLKNKLASFMALSLLAILGTLPLTMFYFNQVSFIGVLANLFYIPLVGCLVLPVGLLSVFVFPVSMDLAGYGFQICGVLLDAGLKVLPLFSDLPFGYFRTVTPTVFEIGLYYAAGWAFLGFLRQKRSRAIRPEGAGKRAVMVWGLLLIAGLGDVIYWTHDRFFREDLRVTMIDVGQGGSALVEFPGGYRMLIDGGGYYDRDGFDVGARVVAPFLRRHKILTLDAVVLTHPDSDHLNGLFAIVAEFRVKTIWTSGAEGEGDHFRDFMELVEDRGIPAPAFDALPRQHRINGVDMEILYPPPGFAREDAALRDREKWRGKSNNRSLVIAIRSGGVGILFPGDIEKPAELDLVQRWGERLRHRVLVAPHHGSRTSSSAPFLGCVRPEVVMVSAGWDNRFRCPHPEVMARYRSMGVRVLRTDMDGALVLQTDGRRLVVGPAVP